MDTWSGTGDLPIPLTGYQINRCVNTTAIFLKISIVPNFCSIWVGEYEKFNMLFLFYSYNIIHVHISCTSFEYMIRILKTAIKIIKYECFKSKILL